jgi:hypothetical protein
MDGCDLVCPREEILLRGQIRGLVSGHTRDKATHAPSESGLHLLHGIATPAFDDPPFFGRSSASDADRGNYESRKVAHHFLCLKFFAAAIIAYPCGHRRYDI